MKGLVDLLVNDLTVLLQGISRRYSNWWTPDAEATYALCPLCHRVSQYSRAVMRRSLISVTLDNCTEYTNALTIFG